MKRLSKDLLSMIKRLAEANMQMEHYWFFPKRETIVVPAKHQPRFSIFNRKH